MSYNCSPLHLSFCLATTLILLSSASFSQDCPWDQQESEMIFVDGVSTFQFSHAIGVDEDWMLIGDKGLAGNVYAYQKIEGSWILQNELQHPGYQEFGKSITMHGDTAFIGGYTFDNDGQETQFQHVYQRKNDSWLLQETLLGGSNDIHGNDISLTTEFALVGDKMYHHDGTSWSLQSILQPNDSCAGCMSTKSSAVSGTLALIGHPNQSVDGEPSTGAVHMYRMIDSQWVSSGVLNGQPGTGGEFGFSVSIAENSVLIGARVAPNGGSNGKVFVYTDDGKSLSLVQEIIPSDNIFSGEFGNRIITDGELAIVSASYNTGPVGNGTAYVFQYDGTNWIEKLKLSGSDTANGDHFAQESIELAGSQAFIGAPANFRENAPGRGIAYVYNIECLSDSCTADLTNDGELNFFDVSAFLSAFNEQDLSADFTADGEFNFFDVSAFLEAFSAGCP